MGNNSRKKREESEYAAKRQLIEHASSELVKKAIRARARAYAPYSDHAVGAAVITEDGRVYEGTNVENASLGLTVCAERVAVFRAVSEGCTKLHAVAVAGPGSEPLLPCGACRQVLAEFGVKYVFSVDKNRRTPRRYMLARLLPEAFSLRRRSASK